MPQRPIVMVDKPGEIALARIGFKRASLGTAFRTFTSIGELSSYLDRVGCGDEEPPRLVLADMASMDGFEVVRRAVREGHRVVLLTNAETERERASSRALRTEYCEKPMGVDGYATLFRALAS